MIKEVFREIDHFIFGNDRPQYKPRARTNKREELKEPYLNPKDSSEREANYKAHHEYWYPGEIYNPHPIDVDSGDD